MVFVSFVTGMFFYLPKFGTAQAPCWAGGKRYILYAYNDEANSNDAVFESTRTRRRRSAETRASNKSRDVARQ